MRRLALTVLAAALALSSCDGEAGSDRPPGVSAVPFEPAPSGSPAPLRPGALAVARGRVIGGAAADTDHLVWEDGALEGDSIPSRLIQRELPNGRRVTLERGLAPVYGLASTREWVVYSEAEPGRRAALIARAHEGSERLVLSRSLTAPIASRGELVAWIERAAGRQRVVVRDMANDEEWIAAAPPRCEQDRCYQLGAVALADSGVVFTRQTSGPDDSFIVRREFSDPGPTQEPIPGDPQPEVVPSSDGALYYALGRGWYRWDFGDRRPRRTSLGADRPLQLLGYEKGHYLAVLRRGCQFALALLGPGGRRVVVSPERLVTLTASARNACVELGPVSWTGRQFLSGWGVVPPEGEHEGEEGEEVVGVLFATDPF